MDEKTRQREYMAQKRASDRDRPPIPPPKDMARREFCRDSLVDFIATYRFGFDKDVFQGNFFPDQLEQIAEVEKAILTGGQHAEAAMRGGGKSSIFRGGVGWALCYGHLMFPVLIGATASDASNHLEAIKHEFEHNDLLCDDFPELCLPIRDLESSSRRCGTHTVNGQRTRIEWKLNRIGTPHIKPEQTENEWLRGVKNGANGRVVEVRSMDGSVRGLNRKGMRPDFVGLDDVETRESVNSPKQTESIKLKIDTDIGGLGSQKRSLGVVLFGTIMREGSVADEYTDPKLRQAWNGTRYRYLKTFPVHEDMWSRYVELRKDADFAGIDAAREYYRENREKMDMGHEVAWVEGYDPNKYDSALEKFYAEWADKKENGLEYVACELQNDPSMIASDDDLGLSVDIVSSALSGLRRGRIPVEAHVLAGFVDVHGLNKNLYWGMSAFSQKYKGWVIDYGLWPRKGTIGEAYPGLSVEAAVYKALQEFAAHIMGRVWRRDDGLEMRPHIGVDSGWGETSGQVYDFCRATRGFHPTKGDNVKGGDFNRMGPKDVKRGDHWRVMPVTSGRLNIESYLYDANYWKRFSTNRILTPAGSDGCTRLFGDKREVHAEFSKHCVAEKPKTLVEKGTTNEYEIFELVHRSSPNHYFDVFAGMHMMASVFGCRLGGEMLRRRARPLRKARTR